MRKADRGLLGRGVLVALAAVAIGATAVTAVALAHTAAFNNVARITKTIDQGAGDATYKGKITSPVARCERFREVQIYDASVQPNQRVARGRSNGIGDWKANGASVPAGHKVYAQLETKVLKSNAVHDHTCKVHRSGKRPLPYPWRGISRSPVLSP